MPMKLYSTFKHAWLQPDRPSRQQQIMTAAEGRAEVTELRGEQETFNCMLITCPKPQEVHCTITHTYREVLTMKVTQCWSQQPHTVLDTSCVCSSLRIWEHGDHESARAPASFGASLESVHAPASFGASLESVHAPASFSASLELAASFIWCKSWTGR